MEINNIPKFLMMLSFAYSAVQDGWTISSFSFEKNQIVFESHRSLFPNAHKDDFLSKFVEKHTKTII